MKKRNLIIVFVVVAIAVVALLTSGSLKVGKRQRTPLKNWEQFQLSKRLKSLSQLVSSTYTHMQN